MSEPFLAEIRIFAGNFAPRGWATCDGQLLPIAQNTPLFSILGTTFGGDGRTTFALPDLRGRSPLHAGATFGLGDRAGEDVHALTIAETPPHGHTVFAQSAVADTPNPAGARLAASTPNEAYRFGASVNTAPLDAATVAPAGAGQGHDNMTPFLALTFIIALQGLFPPRN